jgi:hypothetical protein
VKTIFFSSPNGSFLGMLHVISQLFLKEHLKAHRHKAKEMPSYISSTVGDRLKLIEEDFQKHIFMEVVNVRSLFIGSWFNTRHAIH